MFKATFSPFSGGGGGNNSYYNPNANKFTGLGDMVKSFKKRHEVLRDEHLNPTYTHGESTGSFAAGEEVDMSTMPVFDGSAPAVSMSPSANSAANTPVFSPEAQESVASVFGTNDQRQTAVTGPRQEAKDKIISEINNL
tara:strand:+ start:2995 stop:3411 length:417 start_codon:yes stop_codon:yes gene_type:complete